MKNLYPETNFRSYTTSASKKRLSYLQFRSAFSPAVARYIHFICSSLIGLLLSIVSLAQMGINNFTALDAPASSGKTYTGPGAGVAAQPEYIPSSNNTFTYNFGSPSGLSTGSLSVNGYIAGGSSFSIITTVVTSIVMRRVDNAVVTGNKDILFFAGNRNPDINTSGQTSSSLALNLNAAYVSEMGTAFSQNNLLIGTDNIFCNQGNGNGNNNNIERVDVLIAAGYNIVDAHKYGFPILERGTYNAHDGFKVAVITAIDGSGNPSAYSNVVTVTSANYNNTNNKNPVTDGTYNYFLFTRNGTNNLEIDQHTTNQGIGAVAFRFSDFGIADGTTIYGYSLMANDFAGTTSSDLVDYTNATKFPTNTTESTGGLDPLAVLGIAMETMILPVVISSFAASEKDSKSYLEWNTVTEMNNSGFEVERSNNGKEWKKIGFVPSKSSEGNSTQKLQYSFYDVSPLTGINYYRLKQSDLSGREKISELRSVLIGGDSKVIKTFPNPVINNIQVVGIEPGSNLRLTDMKGNIICRILSASSVETISAASLSSGVYLLQVINKNVLAKTMKVVKM